MSTKTKNTQVNDPLFSALESRLIKQDAATRADRVRAFMESLEAQITGAAVLPANAAAAPEAPTGLDPKDPGAAAVGKLGIFWDSCEMLSEVDVLGVCSVYDPTNKEFPYTVSNGADFRYFLPITLPAPYHQQFTEACK